MEHILWNESLLRIFQHPSVPDSYSLRRIFKFNKLLRKHWTRSADARQLQFRMGALEHRFERRIQLRNNVLHGEQFLQPHIAVEPLPERELRDEPEWDAAAELWQ